jgi:hypothetical protein
MYLIRKWSVSQSRFLEVVYNIFQPVIVKLHPLWNSIGYDRAEKPISFIEKTTKGLMFDCQMCGQCILSSTGMSCSMNCPKSIRNGPCGGVRLNGNCEVKPDMRCVWVEAWRGSQNMQDSEKIKQIQPPVNHLLLKKSSWLSVVKSEIETKKKWLDDVRQKR